MDDAARPGVADGAVWSPAAPLIRARPAFPIAGLAWADFRGHPDLRGADQGEPGRGGWHYPRGHRHLHRGIDLKAPIGTPLLAVEDGLAEFVPARPAGSAGHRVRLRGASGAAYYYLHLGTDPADPADAFPAAPAAAPAPVEVRAGAVVGYLGHTGGSVVTGARIPPRAAHLHFQYHPHGPDREDANPVWLFEACDPGSVR
jgi:murein DD-endopeptidase MepM/ murein hydrolase activator NlpD